MVLFPPHSILFLISQTSYRTYKIISSYELARPVMGTIFLVSLIYYMSVCRMSVVSQINCVGGITWPTRMLKSLLGSVTPALFIGALAWTNKKLKKKSVHLEMRNLKLTELQRLKNRGKKV